MPLEFIKKVKKNWIQIRLNAERRRELVWSSLVSWMRKVFQHRTLKASVGNVQHFAVMEKFQKLFHLQRRLTISNIHVKLLHAIDFFLHKSQSRRVPAAASLQQWAPEWVENLSHSAVSSLALRNEIYEFSHPILIPYTVDCAHAELFLTLVGVFVVWLFLEMPHVLKSQPHLMCSYSHAKGNNEKSWKSANPELQNQAQIHWTL